MNEIKVLIKKDDIQKKVIELAETIMKDFNDEEIDLVCVLSGSAFFATDLAQTISNKQKIHFIKVSSYGNGTESTGNITMQLDLIDSIKNRNVIIVEDIVDSGKTLSYLKKHLNEKNPKSLKICTLLDKPSRRTTEIKIDYIGYFPKK